MKSGLWVLLKQFGCARDGAIMIMGGLMAAATFAIGGAGLEFGYREVANSNARVAADASAISASSSRLYEGWGKVPEGSGLGPQVTARQQNLAGTYYRLNTRDYNVDPDFTPTIQVEDVGDVVRTTINGRSMVATRFISLVGVDQLPYTVNTVTDMRTPSEKPDFDIMMLQDYTTSMRQNLPDGDTRFQALVKASNSLADYVMCSNEEGTSCDFSHKNRIGMIPYALTAMGLSPCDLPKGDPERPGECDCMMPRGFEGGQERWEALREHEGGMPEKCRPICDRVDSNNRPAGDYLSEHFNCHCAEVLLSCPANDKPKDALSPLERVFYERCMPKCQKGGCCPSTKCYNEPGNKGCVQAMVASVPNTPCCPKGRMTCASTPTPQDPAAETCQFSFESPPPRQTICCDMYDCTASCTALQRPPEDPCARTPVPAHCVRPIGGQPQGAPPRPSFRRGSNDRVPEDKSLQMADVSSSWKMQSAILGGGAESALFTPVQWSGGTWAYSLRQCKDDGAEACRRNFKQSLLAGYLEDNTNSAAAFSAFIKYQGYMDFMRPNQDGDDKAAVNVIVWVTDGENTRYKFGDSNALGQPAIIPQSEWDFEKDAWQNPDDPEGLAAIIANRYTYGGVYVPEKNPDGSPNPDYNQPGVKTAQQWSDDETLAHCHALRTGQAINQRNPVIIYTVAVGAVASQTSPEGIHTRKLMTECSYGTAYGPGEDLPDDRPKLFFAVENSRDLNRAFRTIAGSLGNIRIVK